MTKIVINRCYGGEFSLSKTARQMYCERKGIVPTPEDEVRQMWEDGRGGQIVEVLDCDIPRDDADLIAVVQELGAEAEGILADLKIVEIPDDVGDNWYINNYDGIETVRENHRTWF